MIEKRLKAAGREVEDHHSCRSKNPGLPAGQEAECEESPRVDREIVEVLREDQECPFCHFAELKRDGDELVCPVCGYGHQACT